MSVKLRQRAQLSRVDFVQPRGLKPDRNWSARHAVYVYTIISLLQKQSIIQQLASSAIRNYSKTQQLFSRSKMTPRYCHEEPLLRQERESEKKECTQASVSSKKRRYIIQSISRNKYKARLDEKSRGVSLKCIRLRWEQQSNCSQHANALD